MARRSIVTRKDLERLYPTADLDEFAPTHWVKLIDTRSRKVLREDAVVLGEPEGKNAIQYACTPRGPEPTYALVPPRRWQCLEQHGLVRAQRVKYVPDYVRPTESEDGVVYFIQSTGPQREIKIGWSQDVPTRKAGLQTANAHKLVVIGVVPAKWEMEAALHARFAHLRMEGEWFRDAPEIHAFLAENGIDPIPPDL